MVAVVEAVAGEDREEGADQGGYGDVASAQSIPTQKHSHNHQVTTITTMIT